MRHAFWKSLASIGQYIVPLICLAGAVLSAWQRKVRQSLVAEVVQSKAADGMSWREFEMLVGEGFRQQGYQVVETAGGGADGGVDLVLTRRGERRWRVLGLHGLPGMPRHAADGLNRGEPYRRALKQLLWHTSTDRDLAAAAPPSPCT